MTWTKLAEDFYEHPKVVAAGERAELLHVHGLVYCNRHLTDGHIPEAAIGYLMRKIDQRAVDRLIELGIWVKVKDGYQIHDFLVYQPSRSQVLAERKQKSSAGQAGGLAAARARAKAEPVAEPVAKSKPVSVSVTEPFNASSVGSLGPTDGALNLAVAIADVLGVSVLAPLEIQACEEALVQFPYLIPAELVERAKNHQEACTAKGFPIARTVQGLWEAWRSQNDYNADHGRHKPRSQVSTGMTKAFS